MTWMELHVVITAILNKNVTLFLKKKKKNNTHKKQRMTFSNQRKDFQIRKYIKDENREKDYSKREIYMEFSETVG